jgi:hypothetical protein
MYRRYRERRQYRRRNREYRPRSVWMRPSTQIGILAVAVLIIWLILQNGGR